MQDFYDERKRTGAFSWREFSKLAGFKSPNYLKLVCEGKSRLSLVKMDQVGTAMGFVGFEMDYFRCLVKFCNAEKDSVKKQTLFEMQKIALEHKIRIVDADAFDYYDSWENPTIRELAPMMPGAKPLEIAKACCQSISAEKVRDSLIFLQKAGFLKKTADDTYEQTEKTVIGSKESIPSAIRGMHKKMASLAESAVDKFPAEERRITGVTLGIGEDVYGRIADELDSFCRKIVCIANESKNINQVYRLNLQFFPLTRKITGGEHE